MNIQTYKRLSLLLGIGCIGLLVLCGLLFWNYGVLKVQVAFASEQTQIFDDMCTKASQSDVPGTVACLNYVVSYYPSGTKQVTGSRLDRMVERERMTAARAIIASLRIRTGEDLGENPDMWIQKYATR
jgi:hypothetical protein